MSRRKPGVKECECWALNFLERSRKAGTGGAVGVQGLLRNPRGVQRRLAGGDPARLPQARPEVPPGHQQVARGRGQVQGHRRGQRGPQGPREAEEVRPLRSGLEAGAGPGRVRRAAGLAGGPLRLRRTRRHPVRGRRFQRDGRHGRDGRRGVQLVLRHAVRLGGGPGAGAGSAKGRPRRRRLRPPRRRRRGRDHPRRSARPRSAPGGRSPSPTRRPASATPTP